MQTVVKKIAMLFNQADIVWALGASMVLSKYDLVDQTHDIDLIVDVKDIEKAILILDTLGTSQIITESDVYKTKYFHEYIIDGTEVDLISGLAIKTENGLFEYDFNVTSIDDTVNLDGVSINYSSLEDWYCLYQMMPGKEKKPLLIEAYFRNNGWFKAKYFKPLLDQPISSACRSAMNDLTAELITSDHLKKIILELGASMVGFADLSGLDVICTKGFVNGISIGVALNPEIMRGIENGPTLAYYDEYKRVNHLLNRIDDEVADLIQAAGHRAFSNKQSNVVVDKSTQTTLLPHKTVATRAGNGFIGKCGLLITDAYGAVIRLSAILTDMPLQTGQAIDHSKCGTCDICRKICPGEAVKGTLWDVTKSRDDYYDAYKCMKYGLSVSERAGIHKEELCGLCIIKCPYSQAYLKVEGK